MVVPTAYARNEEIFGEGEPVDYLYKIESGCIRATRTHDNGHRQLVAFYLPGNLFGLDAHDLHTISTEATTPSKVRVIKRKALMARGGDMATIKHLLDLTAAELRRSQNHNLLLLKGAQERVVGFLQEMAQREHRQGEIELPMTRRDIADYLGLTIETVSRTLKLLETEGAISLPSRWRVVLHDPAALN
ncbi:MAG: helix-turn-helix domain-containing protein [Rhizobiales bacterium]|nr:helix-turn-helix domain-containing protein [Hyphomicrobiales bacterium]